MKKGVKEIKASQGCAWGGLGKCRERGERICHTGWESVRWRDRKGGFLKFCYMLGMNAPLASFKQP